MRPGAVLGLAALVATDTGRARPEDITLFKSVGLAIEDVALGHEVLRLGPDAAVLVLFSGPEDAEGLPDDADLLVTVRASTLRHHAGQAAFPGGATDPGDEGPVHTALREATEETGLDTSRLQPLATLQNSGSKR